MLNIPKDFREFIELLNKNKVKYLLVGGYAVAYHGHPRSTGDIDFFIESTEENADKVILALKEFGFSNLDITIKDFTTEENIIQFGYPPLRIDILTSVDGITFKEAWDDHITAELNKLPVNIISLDKLLENKKSSGRAKDLADLEEFNQH
ncbi:MAG: nucleotidyl transferase AbiEii/AbiGii toxin family protein [Spirochaetales bacterium]|nr:nucleotidyl transferase AbiEii/AbiGii toxin family protein [Spirochaetales bacterium]